MYADLLIVAVVLVLGITAFVFGVLHSVWRGICFAVGLVFGRRDTSVGEDKSKRRVCPRISCRKVEYRDAAYCCQCGAKLIRRRT